MPTRRLVVGSAARQDKVFSITELVPSGGDQLRFEWDAGSQSGFRDGWEMPISQRSVRTDYPGAIEPSEQVLGPSFEPFTVHGRWDDRYNGGPDVGFARKTCEEFENLVARGNLVRIDYDGLTITGLISNFVPRHITRGKIDYQFTLSPHYRVKDRPFLVDKTTSPQAINTPQSYANASAITVEEAFAVHAGVNRQLVRGDFVSVLDDELAAWFGKIRTIQDIVDNQFIGRAEQSIDAFSRLVGSFASLRGAAQATLTKLLSARSDLDLSVQTAVSTLDYDSWLRGLAYQARLLKRGAHAAHTELLRRVTPRARALYRPQKDESLYNISTHFYGTPHRWRDIQERNGLRTFTLQGTEFLVIPELK